MWEGVRGEEGTHEGDLVRFDSQEVLSVTARSCKAQTQPEHLGHCHFRLFSSMRTSSKFTGPLSAVDAICTMTPCQTADKAALLPQEGQFVQRAGSKRWRLRQSRYLDWYTPCEESISKLDIEEGTQGRERTKRRRSSSGSWSKRKLSTVLSAAIRAVERASSRQPRSTTAA
jgi:hypothetical protein